MADTAKQQHDEIERIRGYIGDDVWVRLDDLAVPRYQRQANERRVRNIADVFNWLLFERLIVSDRDGEQFLVSGNHRAKAAAKAGYSYAPAIVFRGLTEAIEARYYLAFDTDRVRLPAQNKFWAALVEGDTEAEEVEETLNHHGLSGVGDSEAFRSLQAVQAARSVHRKYGTLDRALNALEKVWADEPEVYAGRLIHGLGGFLAEYDRDVDEEVLAEAMRRSGTPKTLGAEGRQRRDAGGVGTGGIPLVLRDHYNVVVKRLRRKGIVRKALR